MRRSREQAQESRTRMVEVAARLLRERGAAGASIADVAAAAGLTHGAFYKHFPTRDALVAEAVREAFAEHARRFDARRDAEGAATALAAYLAEYLSDEHVANPGDGCPVAALGADAGRGVPDLAVEFAHGVDGLVGRVVEGEGQDPADAEARAAAIRRLTALVGALVAARAVGPGALRHEILAACAEVGRLPIEAGL